MFRSTTSGWRGALFAWRMKRSAIAYLDQVEQTIAIADRSWFETKTERAQLTNSAADDSLVQLLWPAIEATWDAKEKVRAQLRCLRVLNALQAYQEKTGEEARQLSDLELPAEVTIDPYTGKPLILKETDAGWVIYSVGNDDVDDGGKVDEWKDSGVGPLNSEKGF